ncbi:MAG: hypothetical protein H0U05_05745, partial [Actinobacteria bacterium]|nr:hypothetical protein [Actinomycetota bacterium]
MSASVALPVRLTTPQATMGHVQDRKPSDGDLIELIAGGDRPAFDEL